MRVLFWGTPDFATAPLRALIGEGHEVVGVVTQPDRPRSGRGRSTLDASPVKVVALEEAIPVLQPDRPRGEEFVASMRALWPDVSVVVAYGHILPKEVIDLPRLGTLNIHASLLPLYRGAAPIQAAIRDGRTETGVSIMRMVPELDAGPVILTLRVDILPDETGGELQLRLAELGAEAIVTALALVELGGAIEQPQDETKATYARKIARDHAMVDWTGSAEIAERVVRAYDPKPGAWTMRGTTEVRLFGAMAVDTPAVAVPVGTVIAAGDDGLLVACGDGALRVQEVHVAGRKRQRAGDWARGRGVAVGDVLGPPAVEA
ncbi:MAG: methionyl-tRNA formyltransferase [Gemmatimonadetes bacterium]|nr:methionyl-tRNA formyltransferase [Gemmatimonadota bacterium]